MKKWISLFLVVLTLLAFAPVAMADPEIDADSVITIINCKNSANVHSKADSKSKKLGEAKRGKTFQLLAAEGDYYKIQFKSDVQGYVYKKFGKMGKKGDVPDPKTNVTVTNAPNGVNIRAKASTNSTILGVAHNGDSFPYKGKSGNWTKITYSGDTAYIYTSYLSGGSSSYVTPVDNEKAYIDCNEFVYVRAKASSDSKKRGTLKKNAEITVTGYTDKWTRIDDGGEDGWVFSKYVSYVKPDEDISGKTVTIVNCKYYVNVRSKASSSSKRRGTADKGDTFSILGRSGKWIKVNYKGDPAFIYKKYVKIG